jgi:hypothetical protein
MIVSTLSNMLEFSLTNDIIYSVMQECFASKGQLFFLKELKHVEIPKLSGAAR